MMGEQFNGAMKPGEPCAAMPGSNTPKVDRSKPVVLQVGKLGSSYWKWVDQPEQGTPRFFGPFWMEAVSKTPWWMVPLLWGPVFITFLLSARNAHSIPILLLPVWLGVGVVSWQLLEYIIHRFLFHSQPHTYWGITLHFLFHGCHHKYPSDHLRLVFPPVPAAAVVALVHFVVHVSLPDFLADPLFACMGMGYVAYDVIHYALHHSGPRGLPGPFRSLRKRHMDHHFRDHSLGFGISSPLWDFVLYTAA